MVTGSIPNTIAVVAKSGLGPHISFAHYPNVVDLKALDTQVLLRLLGCVRQVASHFHQSIIASHTPKKKQVQLGLDTSVVKTMKLVIDVKTRCNWFVNSLHWHEDGGTGCAGQPWDQELE